MKKKQDGAALIVVLTALTMSLVFGISSMNSSQIGERLAGSQKGNAELAMAAERAGADGFQLIKEHLADFLAEEECVSDDLFVPINSQGEKVAFDSDAYIDEGVGDGMVLPASRNQLQLSWEKLTAIETVMAAGGPCATLLATALGMGDGDELGDDACANLAGEAGFSSTDIQCSYRMVTLLDPDAGVEGPLSDQIKRYIVAMAKLSGDDEGLATSLPLFIEMEYADVDINWLFSGPPITFLADFDASEVSINGANNMTLEGGVSGYEISVPPGTSDDTKQFFVDNFDNKHGTPAVTTGGMEIDEFISFVEELRKASVEFNVPGIHYVTEDPDMSDYSEGVLVVADNFTWSGNNDFTGVIIVLGAQVAYNGGGSGNLHGSLIHAPITPETPTYGWVDEDGFVEFPSVERYFMTSNESGEKEGWVYGNSNFDFDFNGGGGSVLENDAEDLEFSVNPVQSAPGFAKATTWRTE